MTEFRASVVIPAFNQAEALELTLAGFTRQSVPNTDYELIVVDDGSTDATGEVLERFVGDVPLKIIRQQNKGRSASRNAGIRVARGEVVILNDGDAIPAPDFIESHLNCHSHASNLVVVGAKHEVVSRWPTGISDGHLDRLEKKVDPRTPVAERIRRARSGAHVAIIRREDVLDNFDIVSQATLYSGGHRFDRVAPTLEGCAVPWAVCYTRNISLRRSVAESAGLFDETFKGYGYEDNEFGYRLFASGSSFHYAGAAQNFHQMHALRDTLGMEWRQLADNYTRFIELHPTLEVFLHWRFVMASLDPAVYNQIILDERAAGNAHGSAVWTECRRLSEYLAHQYCQLSDPSPAGVAKSPLAMFVDLRNWM